ncbi:MAG: HAD-IA family hydrolase [Pseudomonadota bacterium]
MSAPLRLVVFDVDGTLVDSQNDIVAAMAHAFERAEEPAPSRSQVLSIVGLSLENAMQRLAPALPSKKHNAMVEWYKEAYMYLRAKTGAAQSSPLYPGALDALTSIHNVPNTLLGLATGKSRRGLDKLLDGHDLHHFFVTKQVSDHHPSKPNPAMLQAALSETGVDAAQAVMIGDTSFDMEMARSAGVAAIGVTWGYHSVEALCAANIIVDDFKELPNALDQLWESQT